MSGSTSDIISNLPCNVLEQILMHLSLDAAVRTSVLSKKWRHIWTKLPQLVFDETFSEGCRSVTTNKLMMTIYKVLLQHRGPVLKFIVSSVELESCPEIDQLIRFVSNNGIQELTLKLCNGRPYKLPSSLFSCQVSICMFSSLWKLVPEKQETSGSVMLTGAFPVIELLELDHYHLKAMAADEVSMVLCLIRSSPNLEKIQMKACPGEAAPVLELLQVQGWSDISLNHLREVEIHQVSGTRPEFDFIKGLLAKSPILERLLIKLNPKEVFEELRILKELIRFKRLSPDAEIMFRNKDEILRYSGELA
ncbi:F-box/FBD/LRR-repeat protein At2g04230-like [Rhododendron vialii]|uniref:F-box/FBD/LRR-repeat protein At2g04230-like n=1 Tax=Rhododendron vialii TaxID=182163 RepID=UPI00265ED679|nr:F-box/FBD/LRR-repeat protein At2g04230-like [Rhododendron vialii]